MNDGTSKYKILVAEDDTTSRMVISFMLRKGGFYVQEAENGVEATKLVLDSRSNGEFDLIVTDIQMPEMDGFGLIEKVRGLNYENPILVLTEYDDKETIKRAFRLGANDFLEKPVNTRDELTETVLKLINENEDLKEKDSRNETIEAIKNVQDSLLSGGCQDSDSIPLSIQFKPLMDAGGDIFRCKKFDDGNYRLMLVDVAGHSVESSYAITSLLGMVGSRSRESSSLSDLFENLNSDIYSGPFPDIASCLMIANWDVRSGRLQIISAGIPHSLLLRRDCMQTEFVELNGTPLGMFELPTFSEKVIYLREGDRWIFGTDGLMEASSKLGQQFSRQIGQQVVQTANMPLEKSSSELYSAVLNWVDHQLEDDLLAVMIEQPPTEFKESEFYSNFKSCCKQGEKEIAKFQEYLASAEIGNLIDDETNFQIDLAVREAVANCIEHGNVDKPNAKVVLRANIEDGMLIITASDEGDGFDIEELDLSSDELREGQRGVLMMKEFAETLKVFPGEVRMEFRI